MFRKSKPHPFGSLPLVGLSGQGSCLANVRLDKDGMRAIVNV